MTFRQQRVIFAPVTLGRGDEANAAVTMLMVVPSEQRAHGLQTKTAWTYSWLHSLKDRGIHQTQGGSTPSISLTVLSNTRAEAYCRKPHCVRWYGATICRSEQESQSMYNLLDLHAIKIALTDAASAAMGCLYWSRHNFA